MNSNGSDAGERPAGFPDAAAGILHGVLPFLSRLPKGEIDVTGYPKEGGKAGDLGGAISIVLFK